MVPWLKGERRKELIVPQAREYHVQARWPKDLEFVVPSRTLDPTHADKDDSPFFDSMLWHYCHVHVNNTVLSWLSCGQSLPRNG